jgi:uncharacterized protein YcfL
MMKKILILLVLLVALVGCSDPKKSAYNLAKQRFESEFSDYGIPIKFPSYSKVSITESDGSGSGSVYIIEGSISVMFSEMTITCEVPKGAKSADDVDCSSW